MTHLIILGQNGEKKELNLKKINLSNFVSCSLITQFFFIVVLHGNNDISIFFFDFRKMYLPQGIVLPFDKDNR